jgi:argininosuccinate lyase
LQAAAPAGFALATDVAEWLVRQGMPFREAHEIAGRLVSYCEQYDTELDDLTDAQLAEVDRRLTADVRGVLSVDGALRARATFGGTAPSRVAEQLATLRDTVAAHAVWAHT